MYYVGCCTTPRAELEFVNLRRLEAHLLEQPAQFALSLFARELARQMFHHSRWPADKNLGQLRSHAPRSGQVRARQRKRQRRVTWHYRRGGEVKLLA